MQVFVISLLLSLFLLLPIQTSASPADDPPLPDVTPAIALSEPRADPAEYERTEGESDQLPGIIPLADMGQASINSIPPSHEFNPEYAYSFNNSRSGWKMSSYVDTFWPCPAGQEDVHGGNYYGLIIQRHEVPYITDGRVWFQWNNVGSYLGTPLDMKCTLIGISGTTGVPVNGGSISFSADRVGWTQVGNVYAPTFRFEFLNHNTGAPVNVKGHGTLFDIDANQGVKLSAGFQQICYIGSNNWFKISEAQFLYGSPGLTPNTDQKSWATALFDGPYFDICFHSECTKPESFFTSSSTIPHVGGGNSLFGFISNSIAPFASPIVTKTVDKTSVYDNEDWNYKLYAQVANEGADWRFTSFTFRDTVPSVLKIKDVHVYDTTNGVNYDNLFTIQRLAGNVVSASAKSPQNANLYGRELELRISVEPDLDKDWSGFPHTRQGTDIENTGKLITNRGSSMSNKVHTMVKSRIKIKTVNGTHTESASGGLLAQVGEESDGWTTYDIGTGDTFTYHGRPDEKHGLSLVVVNGTAMNIFGITAPWHYDSSLSDVKGLTNYVQITYVPLYDILTSKEGEGTISDSIYGIMPGSTRMVSYAPAEGWYTASVTVDGTRVMIGSSYTFSNIKADHAVHVIFKPYRTITTKATNGTITPTIKNIKNGETKVVSYAPDEGYYLESVTVDGKAVSITDYPEEYVFSDVQADHDIKVVYAPYWKVTTEVVNGTITPDDLTIKKGENRTVSYAPKSSDYYLKNITVDGTALTKAQLVTYRHSYSFTNISADHHVKVVYAKVPVITITKQLEGDVIWAKGSPEFSFTITGTDYLGNARTYHRTITFLESDGASKSVTLKIPAGTWVVSELAANDWSLKSVTPGANCRVNGTSGTITTLDANTGGITFLNRQSDWSDYTENQTMVNRLK